jgi:hypothetical protein
MAISLSWADGEGTPAAPQPASRASCAPRRPVALPHAVESGIEAVKAPSLPAAPKPSDFTSAPTPLPDGMTKKSNRAALWVAT